MGEGGEWAGGFWLVVVWVGEVGVGLAVGFGALRGSVAICGG